MNTINYEEEYFRLIKYYQDNPISKKDQYCETHHIIPRSCGGSDDKSNLVNLPADIHYKVHCYLPFVFKNSGFEVEYHKMVYAWKRLLNSTDEKLILMNVDQNAIEYKQLRESYFEIISREMKSKNHGINNGNYNHHWYTNLTTGESKSFLESEVPEGWILGRSVPKLKGISSPTKDKTYVEDQNGKRTYINHDEIETYLSMGYKRPSCPIPFEKRSEFGKRISEINKLKRPQFREAKYKELKPLYDLFIDQGFEAVVKQFNYKYTRNNLIIAFKTYIPEYVPAKCNRWKNSSKSV